MSDKRRMPRSKKRLSCTLDINGQRYNGLVLDVSATGLFVQTSASPRPGSDISIDVSLPDGESLILRARVARRRNVPAHLKSIALGGLGVRLAGAPEQYFQLVEELQGPREQVEEAAAPAKLVESPPADLARKALLARLEQLRAEME